MFKFSSSYLLSLVLISLFSINPVFSGTTTAVMCVYDRTGGSERRIIAQRVEVTEAGQRPIRLTPTDDGNMAYFFELKPRVNYTLSVQLEDGRRMSSTGSVSGKDDVVAVNVIFTEIAHSIDIFRGGQQQGSSKATLVLVSRTSGKVIPGVEVHIEQVDGNQTHVQTTNNGGRISINLPKDRWRVTIDPKGEKVNTMSQVVDLRHLNEISRRIVVREK